MNEIIIWIMITNVAGSESYNIHAPAGVSLEYGYRKQMPLFITVSTWILFKYKILLSSNHILVIFSHLLQPLKDIAVINSQSARFECIVECIPHPRVEWFKNGNVLRDSNKYVIEFRNGVCRLCIPEAYSSK